MKIKIILLMVGFALLITLSGCQKNSNKKQDDLVGAGSSFIYPLFSQWATEYNSTKGIQINYQAIGSSGGVAQLKAGTIEFACSDQPQTLEVLKKNNWIQFPTGIGGVVVITNIRGLYSPLSLNGPTLADIFLGKIHYWDDPSITTLNPNEKLPHSQIIIIRRSDGSGTTFNFTSYLDSVSPQWASSVGANSTVQWPGITIGAQGSSGVVSQVKTIPNSIGYAEFAYAESANVQICNLYNKSGKLVTPTLSSFMAATSSAHYDVQNGFNTLLINMPGDESWPIVATTFTITSTTFLQSEKGAVLKAFIQWAFSNGQESAERLSYVPLPENLIQKIQSQF